MTQRDVQVRALYIVDQRRVHCDCYRAVGHDARCAVEQAWSRAMRQAEAQLRREAETRRSMYALAV